MPRGCRGSHELPSRGVSASVGQQLGWHLATNVIALVLSVLSECLANAFSIDSS